MRGLWQFAASRSSRRERPFAGDDVAFPRCERLRRRSSGGRRRPGRRRHPGEEGGDREEEAAPGQAEKGRKEAAPGQAETRRKEAASDLDWEQRGGGDS